MKARVIFKGEASGEVLVSPEPISFYGGVDPDTGVVVEKGHALEGKSLSGKILVLPGGKGSTVGSYTLYRLKRNGKAPAGIILGECDTVIAVGAIISEIPAVDKISIEAFQTGQKASIAGEDIVV